MASCVRRQSGLAPAGFGIGQKMKDSTTQAKSGNNLDTELQRSYRENCLTNRNTTKRGCLSNLGTV